jgi:hypothetical protein
MLNRMIRLLGLAVALTWAMPPQLSPLESESRSAGLAFSNDAHYFTLGLIADEDRYYSQGLQVFWNGAPQNLSHLPPLLRRLGETLHADRVSNHVRLRQEIFTPNDLRASPPLVSDDRPFAGWTHVDLSQRFYFQGEGRPRRLHLQINVGVVGPASLADEVQIEFHRLRRQNSSHPELDPDPSEGWAAQVQAQGFPVRFQLFGNHAISLFDFRHHPYWGVNLGGEGQWDVGPLYGHAGLALELRAGRMTRSLYRPMPSGNQTSWEAFGFYRSESKIVGWNRILTGGQSNQVKPALLVWQHEIGAAMRAPAPFPEISLSWSLWSRETQSQPSQPFQPGHIDYRPDLQNRSPLFDHGFGTVRLVWFW